MRRTSRASRRVPRRQGSRTAYARGARPRKGWQKFPRQRCRPSRSSSRQTTQVDGADSSYPTLSCRAKSKHLCLLKEVLRDSSTSLGMTRSKIRERRRISPSYCNQFVNSKFGRRLDDLCFIGQVRNKFWIRLQPPECVFRENKMRRSAATQPLKILDCLLAVVWSAVVNRVILRKMPALAL